MARPFTDQSKELNVSKRCASANFAHFRTVTSLVIK